MISKIEIALDREEELFITLRFDSKPFERYDTYYLALDSGIMPDSEAEQKVKFVLINLLKSWVSELKSGKAHMFFPIDFSDQYIGGIYGNQVKNNILELSSAFTTEITGSEIYPSQISISDINLEALKIEEKKYLIELNDMLKSIEQSISNLYKGNVPNDHLH